jgi:hypothetical protein
MIMTKTKVRCHWCEEEVKDGQEYVVYHEECNEDRFSLYRRIEEAYNK